MQNIRAHIFISGRVQGVFYRAWTLRQAQGLGLSGWVRNLPAQADLNDGRVEIVAEGEKNKLIKLIELIKKGPPLASVGNVDVSWEKATGEFKNFQIVA